MNRLSFLKAVVGSGATLATSAPLIASISQHESQIIATGFTPCPLADKTVVLPHGWELSLLSKIQDSARRHPVSPRRGVQ